MANVAVASNLIDAVVNQLNDYRSALASIETELRAHGSPRNRFLEELADSAASDPQNRDLAQQVEDTVNSVHGRDRVAVVSLLRRVLRQFDDEIKSLLDAAVPKEQSAGDSSKAAELREQYNMMVTGYQAARQLLVMGDPTRAAEFPELSKLRGGGTTGRRGARLAGKWRVTVDGKELDKSQFSAVGIATDTSATDVRVALQQAIPAASDDSWFKDVAPQLETFSFVVNGKTVVYTKAEATNGNGSDEVEDSDNDDIFGSDNDEDEI